MGFELIKKGTGKQKIPNDVISWGKNAISFGQDAKNFLTGDYAEVYVDKENKLVGFKVADSVTGFKILKKNGASTMNLRRLQGISPKGYMKGKVEGDMFVISLPEMVSFSQLQNDDWEDVDSKGTFHGGINFPSAVEL